MTPFYFFTEVLNLKIELNGEAFDCPDGTTLLGLIRLRGLAPERVAAEAGGAIVRRSDFGSFVLSPGERVELVHFVGGG